MKPGKVRIRPCAPSATAPQAHKAAEDTVPMDTIVFGRFRAASLLLLAVALWSATTSHPLSHAPRFWLGLALAATWAVLLFWRSGKGWRLARVAAALGISAAATLADPAWGTLLMISVGWVGSRLPWRQLPTYGGPLVVAAAWTELLANRLSVPIARLALSAGFVNMVVLYGLILLFGRLAADNTEVRAAQAQTIRELQTAHAELQRRADAMEEVAVLQERSRLSRELHDSLGHALSTITVQLEAIHRLLPTDPRRADAVLGQTQEAARTAMRDLRLHLSALRAPAAPRDLAEALSLLCSEAAARNSWHVETELETIHLRPTQRRVLLQVAREALQNCERHAHAARLQIRLAQAADAVTLTVQDDGCGFNPAGVSADRFGLQGMRERLRALDGELRVESTPGKGTRIVAVVPQRPSGTEDV